MEEKEQINELNEYRKGIEFYAKNKTRNLILNSGNDHARIIFESIFKNSEKNIKIFAGNLRNEVTERDDYINTLMDFLSLSNTKLDILLDRFEDDGRESKLFSKLYPYKDKIQIKSTANKYCITKKNEHGEEIKQPVHFCIGDNRMYRLETNIQKRSARCNFNDPEFAGILDNIFTEELMQGQDISWNKLVPALWGK